ncbi:MAG: hypothetical protein ACM3RP_02360 [Chitinophagales bacterium]
MKVRGYQVFDRRYWPVLRQVPNPPNHMIPRLRALGPAPPSVWARAHRYLDKLMRSRKG